MFMSLFLFFSMLLLCSFFRLKELFQVKNGVTTSLRKRGWPNLVLWLTKFVDTLLQPISKSQKSYLSLKRLMWKTEHFLFLGTLWVLTQIYSKTRVYWNCLSQSLWKFLQRQPIPTHYLPEILRLILKRNFFHFNGKHYPENHGTAIGTKTAVLIPLPIFSWHILKQQL